MLKQLKTMYRQYIYVKQLKQLRSKFSLLLHYMEIPNFPYQTFILENTLKLPLIALLNFHSPKSEKFINEDVKILFNHLPKPRLRLLNFYTDYHTTKSIITFLDDAIRLNKI